jgi:hypothetical protein
MNNYPTCNERINDAWQTRRTDLENILDGDIDRAPVESLEDYGLAFDYVPSSREENRAGYWRYQFSTGGPQEELRWYTDPSGEIVDAGFWLLDWFDGASMNVSEDEVVERVLDRFRCMGVVSPEKARDEAKSLL